MSVLDQKPTLQQEERQIDLSAELRFVTTSGRVKFLPAVLFFFSENNALSCIIWTKVLITPSVILLTNCLNHSVKLYQKMNQIADINAFTLFSRLPNFLKPYLSFFKSDSRNLLMWQLYHVHCYHTLYDAADIVITSVTFIQSQLLDVGRHPKDDSWSRGAKNKKSNMDSLPTMGDLPSMPSKYLLLPTWVCLKSSLLIIQIFLLIGFPAFRKVFFRLSDLIQNTLQLAHQKDL